MDQSDYEKKTGYCQSPLHPINHIDDYHRLFRYHTMSSKSSAQLIHVSTTLADSVLAFKKRNKLGRFGDKDPQEQEKKEEALRKEEGKAKAITINSRCLVTRSGVPARKGVVRFVGNTEFAAGWWIGVQYDEPFGKNDGR